MLKLPKMSIMGTIQFLSAVHFVFFAFLLKNLKLSVAYSDIVQSPFCRIWDIEMCGLVVF